MYVCIHGASNSVIIRILVHYAWPGTDCFIMTSIIKQYFYLLCTAPEQFVYSKLIILSFCRYTYGSIVAKQALSDIPLKIEHLHWFRTRKLSRAGANKYIWQILRISLFVPALDTCIWHTFPQICTWFRCSLFGWPTPFWRTERTMRLSPAIRLSFHPTVTQQPLGWFIPN